MTEQSNAASAVAPQAPRCPIGSATKRPCWRPAVVLRDDFAPEGPYVCAEHKRALDLIEKEDEYLEGLEKLQAWIQAVPIGPEVQTFLMDATYRIREDLERDYLAARIEAQAAEMVAAQGEDEDSTTLEDAHRTAESLIREAALMNAYTTLQDLSAEVLPLKRERFETCAVLNALHGEGRYER